MLTWGRILQPVMRTGWLENFIFRCTQWLGDSVKLFRREKNNCFFILFCGKDIQLGDWGRKARMSVCGVQKGLGRWRYWVEYVAPSHCYMGTCYPPHYPPIYPPHLLRLRFSESWVRAQESEILATLPDDLLC